MAGVYGPAHTRMSAAKHPTLQGPRPGQRPVAIVVEGARTHNLKGVSCEVPHGKVTVVTGPSGAGKSSLAFDTIFAEGQRRFVESMSTYARQFLQQMERPPVDRIDNLLPPVALLAANNVKNARSTVGTLTDVNDVLRLLFTHLGEVGCAAGHGPVRAWTVDEVTACLAAGEAGASFLVVARLPRPKRKAKEALAELIRQGFGRRLDGHAALRLEPGAPWPRELDPLPLVLGRFRAGGTSGPQLAAAIEDAFRLGGGRCEALGDVGARHFSRELGCGVCGRTARRPVPPLFSFNSPLGACPECQGFGRIIGVDPERVIPDPRRSLLERPIAPWNTPAYEAHYDDLLAACRRRGVPLDRPVAELSAADLAFVWRGPEEGKPGFVPLQKFFAWLEKKSYRVHVRVLLARYRAYTPCPSCGGRRLRPEALAVTLDGSHLAELSALSVEGFRAWLASRRWSGEQRARAGHLLGELATRIDVLERVGLGYLTLDRQARTLSGGETQRIHLAAALGSGLTSTLYVLDEPTIGLHPTDSARLAALLADLAAQGNTVLVVEHDRTIIEAADHLIDLGPAAGERGGEVMAEGPPEVVLADPRSLTGRFFRPPPATAARDHLDRYRREHGREPLDQVLAGLPRLSIRGARAHNLKGFDVEMPVGALVAVTGVSGSGKSTLVENVLYGTYQRAKGVVDVEPGPCDALEGLAGLADVVLVDQRPLGRSSRSNPVTYVGAYDEIRKMLAATPAARAHGVTAAHFSFNVDKGRCPECRGTGVTFVDMQFMAPVTVVCDRCQGHRFEPEVLAVRLGGRNVSELLELTVATALEVFAEHKTLCRKLAALAEVGLGYLRLGQSTSTLSGGEAQRLKLASFLDRPKGGAPTLFLFDEPTTGLHVSDVDLLIRTLRRLVQRGDGVIVVEHSPDLVARADWIVDLGPGGGVHGGELLYSGPSRDFLRTAAGPTAEVLRAHLAMTDKRCVVC